MNRNRISTLASVALLSAVMVVWADLFYFSKEVHLPEWAKLLLSPISAPEYLTLLCLIPAAFFTTTTQRAVQSVIVSLFVAPLSTVALYALNHENMYIVQNVLFTYGFIILWHCTVPAILLIGARAAYHLWAITHEQHH